MRRVVCLCLFLGALFLASCGPSYPKARLAESLVNICKKEYGVEVKAQVVHTTLGILAPIPGLISELAQQAGSTPMQLPPPILLEGEYESKRFEFLFITRGNFSHIQEQKEQGEDRPPRRGKRAKPLETLDHVSMALNRVCLSTDAQLDFYTLIARDPEADLDVVFSGHLGDLKRVQYWAISRGEFQRRNRITLRRLPEQLAKDTVHDFLQDLSEQTVLQLLSRYAATSTRFAELLPKILQLGVTLQGKEQVILREEWPVRQISRDQVLVFIPFAALKRPGAVLFTVQIREGQGFIMDFEMLATAVIPERYRHLGPPERWAESFYMEPTDLAQFLTEQITKRVLSEFRPFTPEPPDAQKKKMSGNQQPPSKPATTAELTRTLLETSAYVLNSYKFKDFKELAVTDAMKGTRWVISSKELPLYRRRNAPDLKPVP